jgi:hypothetical protein
MNSTPLANLSSQELKLIDSLRRRERRWPRLRWLVLANGFIAALGSGLFAFLLWSGLSTMGVGGGSATAIALVSFMSASLAVIALFSFALMFRRHPIHSVRSLLLKLADAQNSCV